ncbi:hypothetical protein CDD83_3114 [Cordyceps sp. RAO-2017]|nr:hypothetical protein CDD83_3114 [Cordyceps sp. RAO-2017]
MDRTGASCVTTFPTSKRAACDRCRKQKLRCPAKQNDAQSCMRCVKAGAVCTTGYIKRLGQYPKNSFPTHRPAGKEVREPDFGNELALPDTLTSTALSSPGSSPLAPRTTLPETVDAASFPAPPAVQLAIGDEQVSRELAAEGWPSGLLNDILDDICLDAHLSAADEGILIAESYPDLQPEDRESLPNGPEPVDALAAESSKHLTVGWGQTTSVGRGEEVPDQITVETSDGAVKAPTTRTNGDCGLRLCQLRLDICNQLTRISAGQSPRPWPEPDPWMDAELETKNSHDSNPRPTRNAFGDVLCSTSEFLAILRSTFDSPENNRSPLGSSLNASPSRSRREPEAQAAPGPACILDVLSCYFHLVDLYDRLLLDLCQQLSTCSDDPSILNHGLLAYYGLQVLPGLDLGGFPIQQASLQVRILVQTIQYQFEMMEKLVGLPVELRVSDRYDAYPHGLLHGEQNGKLVQGIISSVEQSASCDDDPAIGSTLSLRQTLARTRLLVFA